MRALAAATPTRGVRIAAVLNAKVAPAVAAVPRAQLRTAGVAAMPFPGLDYGNSARLAAQLRIPFLATLDPLVARRRAVPAARAGAGLRGRGSAAGRCAAPRHARSWRRRRGRGSWKPRTRCAVCAARPTCAPWCCPTTAVGASRVLIDWARRRGIAVAAVQHGVYGFKEHDGGDSRADVLFAWSERVREQALAWPRPRPASSRSACRACRSRRGGGQAAGRPRRVLVATTGRPIESALGDDELPRAVHRRHRAGSAHAAGRRRRGRAAAASDRGSGRVPADPRRRRARRAVRAGAVARRGGAPRRSARRSAVVGRLRGGRARRARAAVDRR